MDEQLARIEREAQIILHGDNDRSMFSFYLRRMWVKSHDENQARAVNGRDVAVGFLEMME